MAQRKCKFKNRYRRYRYHLDNINGFEGLLVEDDIIRVMWYSDDVLFTISSQIDKNELIKIAESVQLAK